MTAKIFKSIFLTAIAVLISAFAIIFGFTYKHYGERVVAELMRDGEYISAGIASYGDGYLDDVSISGIRITLISATGEVISDTAVENTADMGNYLQREEVRDALSSESGTGISERYSEVLAEDCIYYAQLLEDGRILRVSTEKRAVFGVFTDMLGTAVLMLVLVILLALLVANRLSHSIVKPINEIDLEAPDNAAVYDELKPMISKLASQRYKIARQVSELRMRQEEFSSITANMSEGMIVINSRTAILSCNDAARRLFSIKELPKSILSLNGTDSFRAAVRDALGGGVGHDEIRTEDKLYSINISPVFQDGAVEGAVVLIFDDTEKDSRERLRREFTSNVSHELKTPLTSISGFAELIRSGMTAPEDVAHFADNIYKEAGRLIVLVGDIIKLTRLDGAEMPYDDEPVKLSELAEETAERLSNLASLSEIRIECDADDVEIPGNAKIIEEIIYNLTDNAIKYNRRGGYVKISVYAEQDDAVVSVKDNGIGIPADKQDRVFERFYRVDKSHSKDIGGTGLGLSIVKHSAAYHKAKITLASEEGRGTEIQIRFPLVLHPSD